MMYKYMFFAQPNLMIIDAAYAILTIFTTLFALFDNLEFSVIHRLIFVLLEYAVIVKQSHN